MLMHDIHSLIEHPRLSERLRRQLKLFSIQICSPCLPELPTVLIALARVAMVRDLLLGYRTRDGRDKCVSGLDERR